MDIGTKLRPSSNIAACHTAVEDISDDGHLEALEGFLLFKDCEHIQETLGGVGMTAISGIDDNRFYDIGNVLGRTFDGVPHNNGIAGHGLHGEHRILEALPFLDARSARTDIDDIGPQIFTGKFKRRTRARAVFIKQVNNGFSPEGRHLLDIPFQDFLHFCCCLHDEVVFLDRKG